jgi:hypothetical protein
MTHGVQPLLTFFPTTNMAHITNTSQCTLYQAQSAIAHFTTEHTLSGTAIAHFTTEHTLSGTAIAHFTTEHTLSGTVIAHFTTEQRHCHNS